MRELAVESPLSPLRGERVRVRGESRELSPFTACCILRSFPPGWSLSTRLRFRSTPFACVMRISTCIAIIAILSSSSMTANEEFCILKARYLAVDGTDIEHGQGAIERNEVPHHPLESVVWLIRVPRPGDPTEWQRRLNAALNKSLGSFEIEQPTPDEVRRVETGEIRFQQ